MSDPTPNHKPQTTGEKISASASEAASTVSDKARETASAAASQARQRADGAKRGVADEVSNVASALRTAAGELREGSPQERTFGQIAEGLADASDSIRNKDLGEMASDVSNFARRNPLVFLGGAALLGFAASRFVKASSHHQDGHTNMPDLPRSSTGMPRGPASASAASASAASASARPSSPAVSTTTGVSPKGTL